WRASSITCFTWWAAEHDPLRPPPRGAKRVPTRSRRARGLRRVLDAYSQRGARDRRRGLARADPAAIAWRRDLRPHVPRVQRRAHQGLVLTPRHRGGPASRRGPISWLRRRAWAALRAHLLAKRWLRAPHDGQPRAGL